MTAPHHIDPEDGDRKVVRNAGFIYSALRPLTARENFNGKIKHYENNHTPSLVL
jgi:hypothetical protein